MTEHKVKKKEKKKTTIKKYFSSTLRSKIDVVEKDTNIICIDVDTDIDEGLQILDKKNTVHIKDNDNECILDGFKKKWSDSTRIFCWNCCHTFDTVPIGMPINFKSGEFVCTGIFCSFPCILRYAKDRHMYSEYKHHIVHMFKTFTGKDSSELNDAPFVRTLKMFGGTLDINEYRGCSDTRIFKYIRYPMLLVRDYIEEIDLAKLKQANDYVFKSDVKPNKKSNILDFLN